MSSEYKQALWLQGLEITPSYHSRARSNNSAQRSKRGTKEQAKAEYEYARQCMQIGDWTSPHWDAIEYPTSETPLTDPGVKTVRYIAPDGLPLSDDLIAALYTVVRRWITGKRYFPRIAVNFHDNLAKACMPNFARVTRGGTSYVDISFSTYKQAATFVQCLKQLEITKTLTLVLHSHGLIHDPQMVGITLVPYLRGSQDIMSVPITSFAHAVAALKAIMPPNICFLRGSWQDAIVSNMTDGIDLQRRATCVFEVPKTFDLTNLPGYVSGQTVKSEWDAYDASSPPHIFEVQYRSRPEYCGVCLGRAHPTVPCRYIFCVYCKVFGHASEECTTSFRQQCKTS